MKEAAVEAEGIGRKIAFAENGVGARQIFEKARLPLQQSVGHGMISRLPPWLRGHAHESQRDRQESRRSPPADSRARGRAWPAAAARACSPAARVPPPAPDRNGNRPTMAGSGTARSRSFRRRDGFPSPARSAARREMHRRQSHGSPRSGEDSRYPIGGRRPFHRK